MTAPNILWVVTTQWRAQATEYAGDVNARTPWLDGLADEAVNFTQAVTPHPIGPLARAALLSGKLCPTNGVSDYWDPLPENVRTIAHALNDRGYATAFFGKWHLGERDRQAPLVGEAHAKMIVPPTRHGGFAMWEGFESGFLLNDPWLHGTRLAQPRRFKGYQAEVLARRAVDWLKQPRSQPVFCVVSLESPHPPYHAPTPNVTAGAPDEIKLRVNVPLGGDVEVKARGELAGYYAHIEATDRAIGMLLAEIDLKVTTVVFTSAHGDMHGSHGLFRKAWPHEESVRVPLLVKRPRVPAGVDASPVSLLDVPHMTLAWAEGREWRCKRDSASISMPTAVGIPLQCPHAWRGFRTAQHKFIVRTEADGNETPWLYFDLERDPFELRNLANDPVQAAEVKRLRALL